MNSSEWPGQSREDPKKDDALPVSIGAAVFHHYFVDGMSYGGYPDPGSPDSVNMVIKTVANHNNLSDEQVRQRYGQAIVSLMVELNEFFTPEQSKEN